MAFSKLRDIPMTFDYWWEFRPRDQFPESQREQFHEAWKACAASFAKEREGMQAALNEALAAAEGY